MAGSYAADGAWPQGMQSTDLSRILRPTGLHVGADNTDATATLSGTDCRWLAVIGSARCYLQAVNSVRNCREPKSLPFW